MNNDYGQAELEKLRLSIVELGRVVWHETEKRLTPLVEMLSNFVNRITK